MGYKDPVRRREVQREAARRRRETPEGREAANASTRRWRAANPAKSQEYKSRWAAKNPEKAREIRQRAQLKSRYGLTPEQLEAMREAQGGVCALCPAPAIRIDHDHETGVVRGLLCHRCNLRLHPLESDPEWLEAALRYLQQGGQMKKYGEGEIVRDAEEVEKTASIEWTEEDSDELAQENAEADG